MRKVVNVLLSTYNGSSWLNELLESLAGQKSVEVKLIWRDDGSTDSSVSIVSNFHNIEKIRCEHIQHRVGPAESYLHLMSHVQTNQFAAFCDQDDVWELDKLQILMKELVL
jgi:glycosyltransferase involved in cell wall biosynthesis